MNECIVEKFMPHAAYHPAFESDMILSGTGRIKILVLVPDALSRFGKGTVNTKRTHYSRYKNTVMAF